ncbi:hypothetical protein H072_5042 [Dactylellina haptotyla CBS 200.50]|uniref:YAG7-like dimerisation domain-containing protein n=1 Tax=Dactylellina haptotyla (strain CBS 200.50) TaxID=1284197 RepID=S8ADM2_DACHA|nr:hypothetical protein H072_5042 [Dactylellina haptotyla CBS 200.50]
MARGQKKAANGGTGASTPKAEESIQNPKEALLDVPVSTSATTETPTTNGGALDAKTGSNAYTKEVEKRLAKWSKKKRGIETIEAKIAGLTPQEQEITKLINNDERKKLAEKVQVEERVKEYHDILTSLAAIAIADEKTKATDKEAADAETAAKVEEAKKAGFEEGVKAQKEVLLTCFRFLRLAGYRRQVPDENPHENEAIEKVLVMVYSSEDSATAAIESLAASKEEIVEGAESVTYARIKEAVDAMHATEEEPVEQVEVSSVQASEALGESTVIVSEADAEGTTDNVPPQALTDAVDATATAPAATIVDDGAANAAAEDWDSIKAGGQSSNNGGVAEEAPTTSWADQSHEESSKVEPATPQPAEEAFQEVPSRSHGNRGRGFRGGRGDFRGNFRGPRGGFRGGRGDGYRGRGEFRGGDRGGFRGRGGDRPFRPRGDRGGHDQPPAPAPAPTA